MGIVGTLVKSGIALNQKLSFDNKSALQHQEDQLRKLLDKAKNTAFGKYYGFDSLLKVDNTYGAFKSSIPIHTYDKLQKDWWCQSQKFPDITWPGKPEFFALSSGTTGKSSKRIPITNEFLHTMRDVGNSLLKTLPEYDMPEAFFEGEILMLTSSANLDQHEDGFYEGEISGINVSNFPNWYDQFYRPGKEIASIDNWNERVARIVEEAPSWNISAVAGIPSWVLLMLQEIVKGHNLSSIHDIWPNFAFYATGGVAYDTYKNDFEDLFVTPVHIIDTYLASEGFFAYTGRPDTMSMQLALSHGYFYEFIPFDHRGVDETGEILEKPEIFNIAQVETGQEYVLVVSSCAGAWRYIIGDTVRFTSIDPYEIIITGRTKFFLNVVGSQLSEEKMDAAIIASGNKLTLNINEYMVAAIKDDQGNYIHQWVIVTDDVADEDKFAEVIDKELKEANKNYGVARNKALKGVKVKAITKEAYYNYLEKSKKKGGQVKTPKVMDETKMRELLEITVTSVSGH